MYEHEFTRKHKEWEFRHICRQPETLPPHFFQHSPFGMSTVNPPDANEPIMNSNFNLEAFVQLGFPRDVIHTLKTGVPLLMHTFPAKKHMDNYPSILEHEEFARETLQKWLQMGVYKVVQERPHIINPLGVVVKDGKQRMVVDASASGLNDVLYSPKFKLPNHNQIMNKLHNGEFMGKADLKNGFLQLPVREIETTFLGFIHPFTQEYCLFIRLPFGLGPATFLFQTFAEVLRLGLLIIFKLKTDVYIDDWFFHHMMKQQLQKMLDFFHQFCEFLGITINLQKTEGPSQTLVFLGLLIDTINHMLSLPKAKRIKYKNQVDEMLLADVGSMSLLAKLAGKLVHVSAVHVTGWAHTQPLWNLLYEDKPFWTKRQLLKAYFETNSQLRQCLTWWSAQLQKPIARKLWLLDDSRLQLWDATTASIDPFYPLTIITDASSSGWGAVCGTTTLQGKWTPHQQSLSNNWRESRAIIHAIERWTFVRNTRVLVFTDNSTAVALVNARNPSAKGLTMLADEISQLETKRDIHVVAMHIPGTLNDLPDLLSRQKPTHAATKLEINLHPIHLMGISPQTLIGTTHSNAQPFMRNTPLPTPTNNFLLTVSTPDIPFINHHLHRWQDSNPNLKGWIIIPMLPSPHLPLPNTLPITPLPPLIPDTRMQWMLLQWNGRE